jgi:CheY-like chemotaxis protein
MKTTKPTLLVVDDDTAVLEISNALLQNLGFTVISTSDPLEALSLLQNNPEIDGLVSDYRMPVMNGEELAQAARTLRSKLPIFILSGSYPPERVSAPWDGWILKGSPVRDLFARLDDALMCRLGGIGSESESRERERNAS